MSESSRPRIGIIGTGAIGGFYGVMLARAGFDVHFLLRSEFAAVAERGLLLNSAVHGALSLKPVQAYRRVADMPRRSEEHTSELQSLMRISYDVFCLHKKHRRL